MTQWAYTPPFTYTVDTTLAIYCTQTFQPQFLPYLHSEPISPHFMQQWACTPSFSYTVSTTFASTIHTLSSLSSSFSRTVGLYLLIYDTVGLYPLIFLHSGHHPRHLLYTHCPASRVGPYSSFCATVGLYPPFSYTVGTTLAIYCSQTLQPQFLL